MKKKIILPFILIIIMNIFIVNAVENKSSYSDKNKFELYQERVQNICNKYLYKNNNEKGNKIKFLTDSNNLISYSKISENTVIDLIQIQKDHKNNMNNIYKCSLLKVQEKSLELINNDLPKDNKLKGKINTKVKKIKSLLKINKCKNGNEKSSIQKLAVLHQTIYQTCKYINYLEYLKEVSLIITNIVPDKTVSHSINEIKQLRSEFNINLDKEIKHTYKVFPIAYHAYTEYENNITAHLLLELLKDDYIILRKKLHQTLNPINQLVYKVNNAMLIK